MTGHTTSPRTLRRALMLSAAISLVSLTGCVIAPYGRHAGYDTDGPYVDAAPPPPQYEVIPVAPALGYVWLGGYWTWNLGRHVWIGGRWALPPGGHHWSPHRWERGPRGWREHPGQWRRR